jgi:hypothetical protein
MIKSPRDGYDDEYQRDDYGVDDDKDEGWIY